MADPIVELNHELRDRYFVERELGEGGMAVVYLATDLKHDRQVAVKVLRPEVAQAIGRERFLLEIKTTANLRHPHILPLFDSGEAGQHLFYVMPYVEGESLKARLAREKQLPLEDALRIGREVADALSYAHARDVVHRDIKPENILLESGHAVVADFGIARALSQAGADRITQTGLSVGTPTYMSPEQASGETDVDGRADLYALACVVYEMLGGQPPFTGMTADSLVHQHLAVEPPPITNLRPAVSPEIAGVLQRALAKNPADRYNPVAQFAEALHLKNAAASTPSTGAEPPSWVRTAILAMGLVAVGAIATVFFRPSEGSDPLPTLGRTVQVTRNPGLEVDPALSPDGQRLVYASGPATRMQIFVQQGAAGRPVALTNDTTVSHRSPRWSPDGSQVAYHAGTGVYVVPSLGGQPRLVARAPENAQGISEGAFTPIAGLGWSPDGDRIAFLGYYGGGVLISDVAGGEPTELGGPREPHSPAWSPDGANIALVSGNAIFVFGGAYFGNAGPSAIWVVPVDGSPPVQVTTDPSMNTSPVWSPDGEYLFWVSDRDGAHDVYRQRVADDGSPTGDPVRLTTGLDAHTISLSADGSVLTWSSLHTYSNVWSIPIPEDGPVSIAGARPVTTGNQTIEDVDVSADGQWIAFDSERDGNADIYKLRIGEQEPIRLTTDPAGDFGAAWSRDGTRIAFHSMRSGNRDLFVMEADGSGVRQVTRAPTHELDPSWGPDGDRIAVEVIDQTLGVSLQVIPLDDGDGDPVTLGGYGDFPAWSPTADRIAFHAEDGIRVASLTDDASELVASNEADGAEAYFVAWSPDGERIYYVSRSTDRFTIREAPRGGGAGRVLVDFDDPTRQHVRYGFSTDGELFYFTVGSHQSDVWTMELGAGG